MVFKIISISHGWFEVDINREFVLVNSDFLSCDAPALLLDALGNLVEGTDSVQWLCWQNEPGAYILKLEQKDSRLVWEVWDTDADSTELDYCQGNLDSHATECVYRLEEDLYKAAEAVESEFSLYENGNGSQRYRAHWGDFPHREFGRLKMLLGKSSGRIAHGGTPEREQSAMP